MRTASSTPIQHHNPDEQHGPQRAGAARGRLSFVMTQKVHSVQIDAAGHERIDRLAKYFGFTQAGAASVIVRAAKNGAVSNSFSIQKIER